MLPIVSVFLLLANQNPVPEPPKPDLKAELKKLEGDWTVVGIVVDGQEIPKGIKEMTLTIKGNSYTAIQIDNKPEKDKTDQPRKEFKQTGTFSIEAGPKVMHLDDNPDTSRDEAGNKIDSKSKKAIYKIVDDTLIICTSNPGQERPTEFESLARSKDKPTTTLLTLKRKTAK